MAYVIYNKVTWRILRNLDGNINAQATERKIKTQMTRCINSGRIKADEWAMDTYENYTANEPTVQTYNLMDPLRTPIDIKVSKKGTHMDPATESYHSA